ncbi:MAG: response regulator transcription factor [Halanaeroarchaeum sp.]
MGTATILVVDDERDLADLYSMWIDDQYDVRTAYGGEEALEKMDDSVHIVLLDRRMPDLTGDEVLERIREQGYEARVVMVTAVDPGLDVIELDFDEYLTKPVSRPELNRVIENMRIQLRRTGALKEHTSVSNKMAALEGELDPETLEARSIGTCRLASSTSATRSPKTSRPRRLPGAPPPTTSARSRRRSRPRRPSNSRS